MAGLSAGLPVVGLTESKGTAMLNCIGHIDIYCTEISFYGSSLHTGMLHKCFIQSVQFSGWKWIFALAEMLLSPVFGEIE